MARNAVQFQKGMSLAEFQARFGSDEQCETALMAWLWGWPVAFDVRFG